MKFLFTFAPCLILLISASAKGETVGQAIDKINEINQMRESLAATLDPTKEPITEQTFKNVCAPVGQSLMNWAKLHGHDARQRTDKYRNPKNRADSADLQAIAEFRKNKNRQFITEKRTINGVDGTQIFRRIDVQSSCLHCHGATARLPEFIKTKYPNDLAKEFKSGDLRGVYSVWIQKTQ